MTLKTVDSLIEELNQNPMKLAVQVMKAREDEVQAKC